MFLCLGIVYELCVCTKMGVFCVLVFVYRDTVLFFGGVGMSRYRDKDLFYGRGCCPVYVHRMCVRVCCGWEYALKRGHGCPGIMWRVSPFSRCCSYGVAFLVIIPYVVYEAVVGRLAGCYINSCLGCNADNANCHGMKLHATPSPQPFIKD